MSPTSPEELLALPQSIETWYLAVRRLRIWIKPEDKAPTRPFLTIVVREPTGEILGSALGEQPAPQQVQQTLFKTMMNPHEGSRLEPHRPRRIIFEDRDLRRAVAPALQAIKVEAKYRDHNEIIDEILINLEASIREGAPEIPGLMSQSGVSPKIVSDFFTAAADFYRAAPWVQLSNDDLLKVRVGGQQEPYYLTVMGRGGVEYGLALYLDWGHVLKMYQPHDHPWEMVPAEGSHSLLFEAITSVPFDDLEAIERYRWDIAGSQAYPVPMIYIPSDTHKRPDRDEILWYSAVLQAIPRFVEEHLERDELGDILPVQAQIMVAGPKGKLPVEVIYPAGDIPKRWSPEYASGLDLEILDDESALPFDRRAVEGQIYEISTGMSESGVSPEVQKAQELMYQAWGESNPALRITLARQALKVSPDCADAYVLLAEEQADTLESSLSYYQKGVSAGRRALGQAYFEENTGHFWSLLETRPFMRAMEGMANSLWKIGRKEEALQTYREVLTLNPDDNQGIRYVLADLLLRLNRYEELADLIENYPNDWSAIWKYTQALLSFREEGASENANQALSDALEQNEYVPAYLTAEKRTPLRLPDTVGVGDESEAVSYAADHLNHWRRIPGAVEWLQDQVAAEEARRQVLRDRTGFEVGDAVKVKEGVSDPDFGTDMSGWQGRISEIEVVSEDDPPVLMIEWDSQTLEQISQTVIDEAEGVGWDWTQMPMEAEEIIPAEPRDEPLDRMEVIWRLSRPFLLERMGEQGQRIQSVLEGISNEDELAQIQAWEKYLREQLTFPFEALIIEQGQGPLKLGDRVKVIGIADVDEFFGVLVQIKKQGYHDVFPLHLLSLPDESLPQFQPVDDYVTWFMYL